MEYPDYPPKASDQEAEYINSTIVDWSLGHGLAMLTPDGEGVTTVHAPVTVYPSPFPKSGVVNALTVQKAFNEVYSRVANDEEWLRESLAEYVFMIL